MFKTNLSVIFNETRLKALSSVERNVILTRQIVE